MPYPEIDQNPNFAKIEENILTFWKENDIFNKSITQKAGNKEFIFYDGPPFANGLPHYGHLLTGFVKDIVARYQTMSGKKVERKFGWDCHGLPAEMEVEKELGVSGRVDIQKYGIDKFNSACRTSVMKYSDEWEKYVTKQARWVDFRGGYKTMDKNYMESVIWAFKELYNNNLLYEDYRVMPYSWKCETPLSNFETRLDNAYRDKESKAITVKFELKEVPDFIKEKYPEIQKVFLLAWTTTPWTLPSNLAIAIGADIDYALVEKDNNVYILANSLLGKYSKEL